VFRKTLKIAATFALLVAGYAGYSRGFAFLSARVVRVGSVPRIPADTALPLTARATIVLAERAFGKGHWTTDSENSVSYYDALRGDYMFFKTYARLDGGKRIRFEPFAFIKRGKKGEALKTIIAKSAVMVFDKPFDMGKSNGEPARVISARLDGDVQLRDDKGTPDRPEDDLTVALLYVEYEEQALQIRALESPIALREGQMTLDGFGVRIDLREPAVNPDGSRATGFSGARQATVLRDVRIHVADVGDSGIVPASAPRGNAPEKPREPVPGRLFCDGSLVIDFPEPTPKSTDPNAPPPPAKPTFARFNRNVVIEQGDPALPDRCDSDQLYLTFLPAETTGGTPQANAPDESTDGDDGTLSKLTLQRAEATGHAVWLRSLAQGMEGRGNELIFEKHAPESPDRIFFRGDNYTRVEQTKRFSSGEKKGQIESIDTIRTVDVTIFQGINPDDPDTIIARGPGRMESRSAKDKPITQSATWGDKLYVQTVGAGAKQRKKITLTGTPELDSPTQGNLKARDRIIAYLKSTPSGAAAAAPQGATKSLGSGGAQIDWMEAIGDVVMVTNPAPPKEGETPDGPKTMHAHDRLDVVFVAPEPAPAAPAPLTPAPAETVPAPQPKPAEEKTAKGPEPAMNVDANKVYAWVIPASGAVKGTIQRVFLRENVTIHQDAAEGKLRGTDISAKNVDLFNRGEGRMYLEAHGQDDKPAKAVTDVFMIQGPIIGMDQGEDYAWVDGKGLLYQSGDGNTAKPAKDENPDAVIETAKTEPESLAGEKTPKSLLKPKAGRGPMEIAWEQGMEFYGKPKDDAGRPLEARAIFRKGVVARTKDSTMWGGEMVAVFDQQIAFNRPKRDPKTPKLGEAEPKPQIALVHATKDVCLKKIDINPVSHVWEGLKQVNGQDVTYNKTDSTFAVDGAGTVRFVGAKKDGKSGPLGTGPKPGTPSVSRVSDTPTPGRVKPATTASTREAVPRPHPSNARPTLTPKPPPLAMTRIDFDKGMAGRFDDPEAEANEGLKGRVEADFIGPVRVIHAPIAKLFDDLDPDDPPADFYIATSKLLHVVQEPPPSSDPKAPAQVFITAEQNATATTPKHAITGDKITYDSVKDLTYVYGPLSGVTFVSQDGIGQPASLGRSSAFLYNNKTGDRQVIDPKSFVMIDPKSATRARAIDPSTISSAIANKKPKRANFKQTPRNNIERRGFNGS
jgi:hypothetical protein